MVSRVVAHIESPAHSETRSARRLRERRDRLIRAHLDLVVAIADEVHRFLPPSFDIEDLVGAGYAALIGAASRYAPGSHNKVPFAAYARQRIRGAMLDSVKRRRYDENTRPTIDGMELSGEVDAALTRLATAPICEVSIDRARQKRRVSAAIAALDPEERELLRIWYGDDEPLLWQVGQRLGIPVSVARALHDKAIEHLRAGVTPGAARARRFAEAPTP